MPQGSVLGPLLYLLYTNEITEIVKNTECRNITHRNTENLFGTNCPECGLVTFYADDATYLSTNKSRKVNQDKITKNLEKIKEYLNTNDLTINMTKTETMEVMIKQKKGRTGGEEPSLEVEKEPGVKKIIKDAKEIRILGANLKKNMTWQAHLESTNKGLLPELRKQLGILSRMGNILPQKTKLTLANGFLMSKVVYLIPLWGWSTENFIKKTQRILNKTARWITRKPRKTKIIELMIECKWLTINEMTRQHSLIQAWKINWMRKPETMAEKISLDENMFMKTKIPRLQFTSQAFRWKTVQEWNKLPETLRKNNSLPRFKTELKRHIIASRPPRQPDPD